MARYTATLRELSYVFGEDEILNWFQDYDIENYLDADQIKVIEAKGTWSKERLAQKIYNHFMLREIGLETPGLFKLRVKVKLQRMMEEKLPLIYSASIQYDPLVNVDFTETYTEVHKDNDTATNKVDTTGDATTTNSTTSNSNTTTSSDGSSLQIDSDTPQGQISKSQILAGNYASSTTANESETSGTSNDTSTTSGDTKTQQTGTESSNYARGNEGGKDYTLHKKGNDGITATVQALIKQYRNVIVAIDDQIIDELEPLFMGIY